MIAGAGIIVMLNFVASERIVEWGEKGLLWLLTGIGISLYAVLTHISRSSNTYSYFWKITLMNAESLYRIGRMTINCLKVETVWSFVYLNWGIIQNAMSKVMIERINLLNQHDHNMQIGVIYKEIDTTSDIILILFIMISTILLGLYYGNKAV